MIRASPSSPVIGYKATTFPLFPVSVLPRVRDDVLHEDVFRPEFPEEDREARHLREERGGGNEEGELPVES